MSDTPPLRFTPPTIGTNASSQLTGRPQGPRERLVVPGLPAAEQHRPDMAPGRIPVAQAEADSATTSSIDSDAIQREKELSPDYHLLKKLGYIREEEPVRARVSEAAPKQDSNTPLEQELPAPEQVAQQTSRSDTPAAVAASNAGEQPVEKSDPLALDLDGDGLETTGINRGVRFDINADGRIDQSSFITGDDAFLALDANANGRIDDGSELFGDQNGDANGYLALARYDDNGDARIDRNDTVFQQLRLFSINSDGSQQIRTLDEGGVVSISVDYSNSRIALNEYDQVTQQSVFTRDNGSTGDSGDLLLGYRTLV